MVVVQAKPFKHGSVIAWSGHTPPSQGLQAPLLGQDTGRHHLLTPQVAFICVHFPFYGQVPHNVAPLQEPTKHSYPVGQPRDPTQLFVVLSQFAHVPLHSS